MQTDAVDVKQIAVTSASLLPVMWLGKVLDLLRVTVVGRGNHLAADMVRC